MLLTGTFRRSLDEKLRIAIPKSFRDEFGFPQSSILYLAPGTDGSLALYPQQSFSRLAEKFEQGSPNGKEVRAFSRLFFAQVQRLDVDKLGRIRLPTESARLISGRKEIVLIGVRDHLEIWDEARWGEYLGCTQARYDELAEQAFSGRTTSAPSGGVDAPSFAEALDVSARPAQPR